jgi:hypothetical protein
VFYVTDLNGNKLDACVGHDGVRGALLSALGAARREPSARSGA